MSKRAGRVGAGTDAFTKRAREMDFRSASREPRLTPLKYTKVVDPNKVGNESGTARTTVLVSYGDGDFLFIRKLYQDARLTLYMANIRSCPGPHALTCCNTSFFHFKGG